MHWRLPREEQQLPGRTASGGISHRVRHRPMASGPASAAASSASAVRPADRRVRQVETDLVQPPGSDGVRPDGSDPQTAARRRAPARVRARRRPTPARGSPRRAPRSRLLAAKRQRHAHREGVDGVHHDRRQETVAGEHEQKHAGRKNLIGANDASVNAAGRPASSASRTSVSAVIAIPAPIASVDHRLGASRAEHLRFTSSRKSR